MLFAEIAVDTYQDPTKRLFTYKVPKELTEKVKEGTKVLVPFGKRTVEGYVFELKRVRPSFPTREIRAVKGPTLTPSQVKLARWMSNYYSAPPLDCLKCQLPGKGERYTEGKDSEIKTLLLVPHASQVKLRALELPQAERKITLVGSRSAVFAPLPNLKRIIIEEPENWAYKDERCPYYHAKDVAQKRAELEGLKLELHYLVPRVEDFPIPPRKTRRVWDLQPDGLRNRQVEIVDLKKERDAGNFSPLSSKVVEAFKRLNLSGLKTSTRKVGLAYVISREVKEGIEQAIRTEGLDVNRIEITGAEIFTQVGKAFDVIALIDADTLFNLPDFRAHEKLLSTIAKLSPLTRSVLVQTANPDHPLFEELKTGNLESFYQRELKERKPLLYPPFGVLAKLEFSAKTTAKVNFEAEKLHEKLLARTRSEIATLASRDSHLPDRQAGEPLAISISPPYPPYAKTRGKAQLNIAVRAKTRGELQKILAHVPPTWRIIVDPESLL